MICKKCGSEIDNDSVFCAECGERVSEPETIVNDTEEKVPDFLSEDSEPTMPLDEADEKAPDFLSEDSEPTMLLNEEELQDAFINEYGGDSVPIPDFGNDLSSQSNFFYNSDIAENTDDLMPYNEYRSPEQFSEPDHSRPKSFNDNSDTMSLDDLMADGYIPDQPYDEPYNEPYGQPYDEPYNEPYGQPYDEPYNEPYGQPYDEPYNEPYPQGQEQPSVHKQKNHRKQGNGAKKSVRVGAGRIISAVFVSVFALFFLLLFSLTLSIKLGLSGGIVRNNIAKLDDRTLLESEFDGGELSNTLFGTLGLKSATGGMATESSFRNYMLRTDFVNYIGRTAHSYLDYIIDGKGSDPSITSEDFVYDFVKGNNRASIEEWGYSMSDNEYRYMVQNLENDGFSDAMSIPMWSIFIGFSLRNLKFLFSFLSIAVFLIITVLLFIWICIAVNGSGKHIAGFFGGILNISGVIMVIIGGGSVLGSALAYVFTHQTLFYILSHALMTFALIAGCTGLAEIILAVIFKAVRKRL